MNYNSIKNFFSPIKLNPNRSEFNVFTSSERKRNSNENNIDLFHTNTIKRGKESENYDSIKKIKNVNQRIDDVISFLNQKQEHIENFQNKTFSSNEKFNWNKYIMDSKKKTEYEKIKENEILKERNAYLKKKLKQIKLKNEISNNDTNSSENSNYYFLLNKNKQLINENKNLKEEYNILKLDQKSNTNINRINVDITEILKFLNKKYKDKKTEIKDKINNLNNKNENLKNKKLSYETHKNELKKFIDENKDKVKNAKNKIHIDNGNKQCMSFIFDKQFQEELEFLNENKKEETIKKTQNNNDDDKEKKNIDKANQIKVLHVNNLHNKLNEKCNSIKNINVNNLLINNNINIENNNNIINNENNVDNKGRNLHTERLHNKNVENKLNYIPKANNGDTSHRSTKNVILIREMKMLKNVKGIPLKKIKLTPQKQRKRQSKIIFKTK